MVNERREMHGKASTSSESNLEQSIIRQMLHTKIPVKFKDLLEAMPHLRATFLNTMVIREPETREPSGEKKNSLGKEDPLGYSQDPIVLALNTGRHPVVVEMAILLTVLTDTIVGGGSRVNVLPEEAWQRLGKPTLWSPTFQLLEADQHVIKPIGTLMA